MANNATSGYLLGSARVFTNVEEAGANGQRTQYVVKDLPLLSAANQRHRPNQATTTKRTVPIWGRTKKTTTLRTDLEESEEECGVVLRLRATI